MKIRHRIHARKVVLTYLYRHGFVEKMTESELLLEQMTDFAQVIEKSKKSDEEQIVILKEQIQNSIDQDPMEKVDYLTRNCFENRGYEQIDMEYVSLIVSSYEEYKKEVAMKVNQFATTFSYEQMDMIDQSIFILGYVEFLKIGTPKEVLLNEMVEISKRYGDQGSSKLINGILHQMIVEIEGKDKDTEKKKEIKEV